MTAILLERPASAVEPPATAMHADRLASHSELLASWLARSGRKPARWAAPDFGRTVDLVRSHLKPIADRDVLARSYAREHFHVIGVGQPPAPGVLLGRDATEVAYAVRWLELGDARSRGPWSQLLSQARQAG
jgi:hypothetical protein